MGTVCQCCAVLRSSYCPLPSWVLGGASAPGRITEIRRLWVPTGDAVGRGCCPQPFRIPDHPRVLSGEDGSKGWDALSCSLSPHAAPSSWGGDCPEDTAPGTSRWSCPCLLAPALVLRSGRRMRPDESRSFQGALTQLCCVSAARIRCAICADLRTAVPWSVRPSGSGPRSRRCHGVRDGAGHHRLLPRHLGTRPRALPLTRASRAPPHPQSSTSPQVTRNHRSQRSPHRALEMCFVDCFKVGRDRLGRSRGGMGRTAVGIERVHLHAWVCVPV
ncbi:hypothetical protein Cadr_000030590 [Camelus dromedarius]|uniref:Uncharacterized protein n=1 Tax=Camelus dromedarius TaxID=9838 RepID=A0A5N4C4E0_CAMDR|nr:hypothetical protein Cadr_000030590 [Camelus dromedarius]